MNAKQLASAIRKSAEDLADRYQNTDDALPLNKNDANDHAELLRVLARVLEGKIIITSFGAPGDWGYHHPIGKALAESGELECITLDGPASEYLSGRPASPEQFLAAVVAGQTKGGVAWPRSMADTAETLAAESLEVAREIIKQTVK